MSKRKVKAAVDELMSWLPNYDWPQRAEIMEIIGRVLASLPGGDEFEDIGYKPYSAIGWKEFEMIGNLFNAVDDKMDVQEVAEMMLRPEEEE